MKKKLLSMVLAVCMTFTMLPTTTIIAQATASDTSSFKVSEAMGPPADTTEIVYGGQRWYVIGLNGTGAATEAGSMTLLAKTNLGGLVKFDADFASNEYATSDLKTAIENSVTFTSAEESAIKPTTLIGGSGNTSQGGMSGPTVDNAILWPLDVDEANDVHQDLRESSAYWWLRSPGKFHLFAACVFDNAFVGQNGNAVDHDYGVRPAFKLKLSSVLFASDAVGGKSGTYGATLGATAVPSVAQKLTVEDSALSAGTVTALGINSVNQSIYLNVVGATAAKSVSAMITDSTGKVKYYGKIGKTNANGNATKLQLMLPVTLDTDNVLKIFVETINGDNLTDYASAPVVPNIAAYTGTVNIKGKPFKANMEMAQNTQIVYGGKVWYVIGADGKAGISTEPGSMTLLAKTIFSSAKFNADKINNAYAISDLKTAIDSSVSFTPAEEAAIKPTHLAGGSAVDAQRGMSGPDIDALLWPLDVDEGNDLNSGLRWVGTDWWLRSPGEFSYRAAHSYFSNAMNGLGSVVETLRGFRPATKLNLSSVLFASNTSSSEKTGIAGSTLTKMDGIWDAQKLTVVDSSLSAGTVTASGAAVTANTTIKVAVEGGTAAKPVSAIITDSTGNVKYYGKIGETDASGNASNLHLTLPVTLGTDNVLRIFVETINGGTLTDYGSAPVAVVVDLPVNAQAPNITNNLSTTQVNYIEGATAAALNAAATVSDGGTVSYQWYSNDTNDTNTPTPVGLNSAVYTPLTAAAGTTYYYCVVTNTITNNGDGGNKTATTTSSIANIKVAVTTYTITVTAGTGGSISPSGLVTLNKGESKTFTITPNSNYSITDVNVDSVSQGKIAGYTFSNVIANHTISATFSSVGGSSGSSSSKGKHKGNNGIITWDNPFVDVKENDWFYKNVESVYILNLMRGTSATTFEPNASTTRGMLVTVLYNMAGKPYISTDETDWYSKGRAWAIAKGISDGTRMQDNITREQLVTMLWRKAGEPIVTGYDGLESYHDASEISDYAQQAFVWAHQQGIIQGKGNGILDPKGNVTRAEVATMMINYLNTQGE